MGTPLLVSIMKPVAMYLPGAFSKIAFVELPDD
jgi:hypothetical protein